MHAVFGPPGLLLYGISKLIMGLDFAKKEAQFDWLHLDKILVKWSITLPQFVEACMLAGTEYCLTYPFLNLDQYHASPQVSAQSRFNFDAAVEIVKSANLINWLQTFPSQEMKNDHVDGYCTCKVLLLHCPVYDLVVGGGGLVLLFRVLDVRGPRVGWGCSCGGRGEVVLPRYDPARPLALVV